MHPNTLAVILERISELVESKMAVSKAIKQVAKEVRDFDAYCNEGRHAPREITTTMLRKCKI